MSVCVYRPSPRWGLRTHASGASNHADNECHGGISIGFKERGGGFVMPNAFQELSGTVSPSNQPRFAASPHSAARSSLVPRGDRLAAAVCESECVPNPEGLILTSALMIFWKCEQWKILPDLKEGICKIEKV